MEIEAKFIIPDAAHARALRALTRLGAYHVRAPRRAPRTAPRTLRMRDRFYDTRARALHAAHYLLRVRFRSDGKTLLALKTPTTRRGAIHRRAEIECQVDFARAPRVLTRAEMPKQIARRLAPVTGDAPFYPLVSLAQTRRLGALYAGRRLIGEWSVDRVEMRAPGKRESYYVLEVELKGTGTEAELENIVAVIRRDLGLLPQAQGKFQRALQFAKA